MFIKQCSYVNHLAPNVSAYICTYDGLSYDDALFAEHDIDPPNHIQTADISRKSEYLAGRLVSALSLASLGLPRCQVPTGGHRQPVWPLGVVGSISHTKTVAAAVSSYSTNHLGLGIDVEQYIDPRTIQEIKTHLMTNQEEYLLRRCGFPFTEIFTATFSAKEAFFKAAFNLVQRYFDFDAVTVLRIKRGEVFNEIALEVAQSLHTHLPRGLICTGRFKTLEDRHVITFLSLQKL